MRTYKELRWILRGLSGLIILFSLLMFFGENNFGQNPEKPITSNEILQFSILGTGLIGLALAWKWELIGGIISLVPFIVLSIIYPAILESLLILVWPRTAILFILLWALSRKSSVKPR